uniref:Uncharacterized protein n=1 Tax=Cacopsylla melanoneura TaxID=428564 RepID=A0A8D8YQM3_9HEMI
MLSRLSRSFEHPPLSSLRLFQAIPYWTSVCPRINQNTNKNPAVKTQILTAAVVVVEVTPAALVIYQNQDPSISQARVKKILNNQRQRRQKTVLVNTKHLIN